MLRMQALTARFILVCFLFQFLLTPYVGYGSGDDLAVHMANVHANMAHVKRAFQPGVLPNAQVVDEQLDGIEQQLQSINAALEQEQQKSYFTRFKEAGNRVGIGIWGAVTKPVHAVADYMNKPLDDGSPRFDQHDVTAVIARETKQSMDHHVAVAPRDYERRTASRDDKKGVSTGDEEELSLRAKRGNPSLHTDAKQPNEETPCSVKTSSPQKKIQKHYHLTAREEHQAAIAPFALGIVVVIIGSAVWYMLKHTVFSPFDTTHHHIQHNGVAHLDVALLPENDPFLQTFGALISQAFDLQNIMFSMVPFLLSNEANIIPKSILKAFGKEADTLLRRGFEYIPYDRTFDQTLVFHMCADDKKNLQSIETVLFKKGHEAINDHPFHDKCYFLDMRLACEKEPRFGPSCTMTAYSGAKYFEFHEKPSLFNKMHQLAQQGALQAEMENVALLPVDNPLLQAFSAVIYKNSVLTQVMFKMVPYLLAGKANDIPVDVMTVFRAQSGEFKGAFSHISRKNNSRQTLFAHICTNAAKEILSIEGAFIENFDGIHDPSFHEKCEHLDMRLACERGGASPSCTMTAYSGVKYFEFMDDNTPFQNAYRAMQNSGAAQFGVRLLPQGEPLLQTFGAVLFHNHDLVNAMFTIAPYLLAGKPNDIPADVMTTFHAQSGDFKGVFSYVSRSSEKQTLLAYICTSEAKTILSIETIFVSDQEAIHDTALHEKCDYMDMRLACERGDVQPSCTMTAVSIWKKGAVRYENHHANTRRQLLQLGSPEHAQNNRRFEVQSFNQGDEIKAHLMTYHNILNSDEALNAIRGLRLHLNKFGCENKNSILNYEQFFDEHAYTNRIAPSTQGSTQNIERSVTLTPYRHDASMKRDELWEMFNPYLAQLKPVFNFIYDNYILTYFILSADKGNVVRYFHTLTNSTARYVGGCRVDREIDFQGAHILLVLGRDGTTYLSVNLDPVYPKTPTTELPVDNMTPTKSLIPEQPTKTKTLPQPPADCGNITSYRANWNVIGANDAPYWDTILGPIGNIVMRLSCTGKTLVDLTKSMLSALTHNYRFDINLDGNRTIIDQTNSSLMPRLRATQAITLIGWFPKGADVANFLLWAHTIGTCQPENSLVSAQPAVREVVKEEVCEGLRRYSTSWIWEDVPEQRRKVFGIQCFGSKINCVGPMPFVAFSNENNNAISVDSVVICNRTTWPHCGALTNYNFTGTKSIIIQASFNNNAAKDNFVCDVLGGSCSHLEYNRTYRDDQKPVLIKTMINEE